MNTSVSPLPLPLWPTLALSLTLFALTAVAVMVSGHYNQRFHSNSSANALELAAPSSADWAATTRARRLERRAPL